MNSVSDKCFYVVLLWFLSSTITSGVRVNPCPTNKVYERQSTRGRTIGHFVQLFADDDQAGASLQERPEQADCDDIGDYDDTDFSSITNQYQQNGPDENRLFFNHFWKPPQPPRPEVPVRPQKPQGPVIPQRPEVPYRPISQPGKPPKRPPPGGYLSGNQYRPPNDEHPSDHVKPVHESNYDIPAPYRPTVVGGSVNQIVGVGVSTLRPPRPTTSRPPCYYYTLRPTTRPQTRSPKTGRLSNSVIGSFIDLFFE